MISSMSRAGVRFDQWEMHALVDNLIGDLARTLLLVTPNVDHVVRCQNDADFCRVYQSADVSVNDSRVLALLFRLTGLGIGRAIPGSDLTAAILERVRSSEFPIAILGCSEESVARIRQLYALDNVAHYNPPMGFMDSREEVDRCIDFLKAHPERLFFMSVGSPRQEVLARQAIDSGATGVFLCVGASLLFLSGDEVRAPRIVQRMSLEWLFRLMQSPRRLARRYLIDGPRIFLIIVAELRKPRR
ncbi:MAG: WecB/TagA/CpsF family glycosyltransferase [Moraxellaceae bacterium]